MKTALELIADERKKQIEVYGYTVDHDRKYRSGELERAAAAYAVADPYRVLLDMHDTPPRIWPFGPDDWNPSPDDPVQELVVAGALIVAVLEKRLEQKSIARITK